jgi:hypothetical protein
VLSGECLLLIEGEERALNPGRAVKGRAPVGRGRGNVRLGGDHWAVWRSLIPVLEVHLEGDA